MKTNVLLIVLAFTALSFSSKAQFNFSVSPGLGFNTASFGVKSGIVAPYIGFQFLKTSSKISEEWRDYDWYTGSIINYDEDYEMSATIFLPNFGARLFMVDNESLKAYANVMFTRPILRTKQVYNGKEDEEIAEDLKKLKLWGGEIGFGAEYFFDEHFSIGGEFGFRYIHATYENSYDYEVYNPNTGNYEQEERSIDLSLGISPTYSKITANFYF